MSKRFNVLKRTIGFEQHLPNRDRPELIDVEESISGNFRIVSGTKVRFELDLPNGTIEKLEFQVTDDYEVLCRPIFKVYKKGILKTQTLEAKK